MSKAVIAKANFPFYCESELIKCKIWKREFCTHIYISYPSREDSLRAVSIHCIPWLVSKMARVQSLSNFGSILLFSEDKFGSLSLAWNWKKNVINVVYAIYWQNHPFSAFTSNCSDLILLVLEDTFKVTSCTSLWKARQSFGRGVSSLSLLCFLCWGRGRSVGWWWWWGVPATDYCWVWMDDTGHGEPWQPASGSLPS